MSKSLAEGPRGRTPSLTSSGVNCFGSAAFDVALTLVKAGILLEKIDSGSFGVIGNGCKSGSVMMLMEEIAGSWSKASRPWSLFSYEFI